jgi:hypothetical protein
LKNPGFKGFKDKRHGFFTAFRMTMGGCAFSLVNEAIIVFLSNQVPIVPLMTMGCNAFSLLNAVTMVHLSNRLSIVIPDLIWNLWFFPSREDGRMRARREALPEALYSPSSGHVPRAHRQLAAGARPKHALEKFFI